MSSRTYVYEYQERVEILRDVFMKTLESDTFQQRAQEAELSLEFGGDEEMVQRMQAAFQAATETEESSSGSESLQGTDDAV